MLLLEEVFYKCQLADVTVLFSYSFTDFFLLSITEKRDVEVYNQSYEFVYTFLQFYQVLPFDALLLKANL